MWRRVCLTAAVLLGHGTTARADSSLWFGSVNYESGWLVVPVFRVVTTDGDRNEWSLGVAGWTLSAELKTTINPGRARQLFARVTPVNAGGGRYIYHNGQRAPAAEFNASSAELGGGIALRHREGWTGDYRVLAFYNAVRDLDPELEEFWKLPFAGVEIAQSYVRVTSDELFGSRWEGVKAEATARLMTGSSNWSRMQAQMGVGKRAGRLMLSGRAAAFGGRSLNTVSTFVIGGSWDLAVPELLVGYRYGEVRLDRAATLGGALDLRLRGPWEIGVRGAYLRGQGQTSMVWQCR